MKILILTGCDSTQEESFGKDSFDVNKKYAEKNGYDFKAITGDDFWFARGDMANKRTHNWSKIALIARYIDDYDYVMWIDADAWIMNHSVRIEEVFEISENDRFSMRLAPDSEFINCGVFVMTNDFFSRELLREWTEMGFRSNDYFAKSHTSAIDINMWEQSAWNLLYRQNWRGLMSRTLMLDPQLVNSHLQREFWRTPYQPHFQYIKNYSFILHLAGLPNDLREKYFKEIIKPNV